MQPDKPEQDSSEADLFQAAPASADVATGETADASFGSRLRAAREARGLDIETCAHTLKLPARVLRRLERDDYDGIDSKIYLGSYISKYARYLEVNQASLQVELDRIKRVEQAVPALVATGGISHSRYLLERYATAATYVVLTAVIVVPMIWFGVRGTLESHPKHLALLDAAPVAQQEAPLSSGSSAGDELSTAAVIGGEALPPPHLPVKPVQVPEQPLLASMAPFPDLDDANAGATDKASPAADTGSGSHSLSLSLSAASWVEVTGPNGNRLEYGLLSSGSHKVYHSDTPLNVRIGNVNGAQVSIDGQPIDLDGFKHANVAHFRMQVQDGKASAANL